MSWFVFLVVFNVMIERSNFFFIFFPFRRCILAFVSNRKRNFVKEQNSVNPIYLFD